MGKRLQVAGDAAAVTAKRPTPRDREQAAATTPLIMTT